uniref:Uncharacterized protein n=1 Tax=Cyprinus carpio TaxID=7962 RepID=A0A8C2G905_CYPCA
MGRLAFITCRKAEVCSVSLTVSQGEGLTVIASNPKSRWPVLCQILGFLCCSPVCSVSQNMKGKLTNIHTALGTMPIIVGVINIVLGILLNSSWIRGNLADFGVAFWIGGVVLVVGIVTILAAKFPSPFLLVITVARRMKMQRYCISSTITTINQSNPLRYKATNTYSTYNTSQYSSEMISYVYSYHLLSLNIWLLLENEGADF